MFKRHLIIHWIIFLLLTGITEIAIACWKTVIEPNALVFISTQAGAPLEGTFHKFDAEICLEPVDPDAKRYIRVTVDTSSVDTMLPELDDALRGPDFLDSAKWPQASFVSDTIKSLGNDHYKVTGKFTLRDVTRTIEVPFDLEPSSNGEAPRLKGSTAIKRLDYHVGLGEWQNTKWVGDEVILKFSIKLKAT